MALINLPHHFSIPFVRHRFLPLLLLGAMMVLVLGGLYQLGLNWGVDFRGGLVIEAEMIQAKDLTLIRKELRKTFSKEFSIQELGQSPGVGQSGTGQPKRTILVRTEPVEDATRLCQQMKTVLGKDTIYRRIESVGPKVGRELIINGCYAILWALLGMMIYVWIRFEWQFSVCALVALLHDCLGILAFFIISRLEFNEGAVVAILITASYSINDTVVIFDRLRDIRRQHPSSSLLDSLNQSLNETFSRTLLTSSTTLLALTMLYFFGGEVIAVFSLPIFVGILIGTYSSVIIAVPLLRWLPLPRGR